MAPTTCTFAKLAAKEAPAGANQETQEIHSVTPLSDVPHSL